MILIDLINNLALLAALTLLSGFIAERCRRRAAAGVLQGLLFGGVAVVGMLSPLELGPGLIFDGRSVVLSLGALFFGPAAAVIAAVIAAACRLWLGGVGQTMGVLVIAASAALGLVFHYRYAGREQEVSTNLLWALGMVVHAAMILLMLTLPYEVSLRTLQTLVLPVLLVYPLATVLIGRVLSDQWARARFTADLQAERDNLRAIMADLRRIEWLLSKKPPAAEAERREVAATTGAGDDGCRILKAVGRDVLANIVSECLDLLGTASAIHEADGRCSYKRVESGWCRLLDEASSRLAQAPAHAGAPGSAPPCEEGGWDACARLARQTRAPAETVCPFGLRLYAVPVLVRDAVVGTIGVSYGELPRDPARNRALAEAYGVDSEALLREAAAYDARPPYIVEMAKRRLQMAAWLIGSLVETRQAEADRVRLEAQVRHSHKMEAIGRLAGGVAHDFNNILQGIIGYGELLVEKLPAREETHEFAREIVVEGRRAASLTRQLLAFARKQATDPKVLDLNESVAAALKMLRRLLGEEIELAWTPAPGRCRVRIDPGQLEQILANLAVNARDAIAGPGRVAVEARAVALGEADCAQIPGRKPGRYILLTFGDTGCGMDRAVLEHLFEPFFTTKAHGRGTGLGLATVYGIVDQSGGFISVASEVGRGSTFSIYLPEQTAAEVDPATAPTNDAQPSGSETVLIVDDEEALLRSARRTLESLGYTVLAASTPDEALRIARSHEHEIHVLLTDVVMPGMSGRDLWLKLEQLRPSMRCIFMSGYTANIIAQRGALNKGVSFLQKPFSKAALANKLRDVLLP